MNGYFAFCVIKSHAQAHFVILSGAKRSRRISTLEKSEVNILTSNKNTVTSSNRVSFLHLVLSLLGYLSSAEKASEAAADRAAALTAFASAISFLVATASATAVPIVFRFAAAVMLVPIATAVVLTAAIILNFAATAVVLCLAASATAAARVVVSEVVIHSFILRFVASHRLSRERFTTGGAALLTLYAPEPKACRAQSGGYFSLDKRHAKCYNPK